MKKVKKTIGYILIIILAAGWIVIVANSPWFLIPLSILATVLIVGIGGLLLWLFGAFVPEKKPLHKKNDV